MISQCCAQQKVLYGSDDGGDDSDAFDDGRPGLIAIIMMKTLNMIQAVAVAVLTIVLIKILTNTQVVMTCCASAFLCVSVTL